MSLLVKLRRFHYLIKKGTLSSSNVIDKDCVVIDHDASLQTAMEIASDFVGEIIPIIETNRKKAVAVITEGAIFQAYLSKQNQTVEMEKGNDIFSSLR